ncbi:MAG: TonB-dependent receptor [Woeseiaceae bacterium]|nr:TonB-dependent receptor [Woeseiaceae bacterium]
MKFRSIVVVSAFAVIPMLLPERPVLAQSGDVLAIEEIIVTARKREENLQEVPIAVTAFTTETIQELQLRNASDIASFTPGFSFISSFGRDSDRPVVRGMSNILGEANASFFIDGVYVPSTIASTELQNLERIEVIKGPQAALYGRATFAGAINYVTKRPSEEHQGQVAVTGAEHSEFDVLASISGPLSRGRAYYYLAASHYEYGGEYTNTVDGDDVGAEETDTVTAKLLLTPNDDFEASLRVTFQQDDDDHIALFLQGANRNNCFDNNATRPASRGYYCGIVDVADSVELRTDFLPEAGIERDILRAALTFDWDFAGGYTLHSVSGMQQEDTNRQIDVSYAAYDPLLYLYGFAFIGDLRGSFWRVQEEETESLSQELRISSPRDRDFRWTLGAYAFRSQFDLNVNDRINPLVDTPGALDPSLGVQQPNSFPETQITENLAIFGGIEYDFSDQVRGTFEIRRADDRKSADFFPVGGVGTTTYQDATFDSVTPRATLTVLANDDVTFYGNIAKGNKPGGFNDPGAPNQTFDEEESWNYEFGVKSLFGDGRVRANLSFFYIEWDDQQLTLNAQRPDGTITSFIENVGETEVTGVEIEADVLISDNWDLSATYAFINSEITEYVNDQQALFFGCVPPGMASTPADVAAYLDCVERFGSVAGNQSPRSSKHQASLRTMATFPTGENREWYLGGNLTFESSRFAQVHNLAETGDSTRVNVQFGYRTPQWDFMVWGKNVFDDRNAQDILRYIDTRAYVNAPFIPCPPPPFVFRTGQNCGPLFSRQTDPNGNTIVPRGFGITLPRGRQVGATVSFRF